MGHGQRRQGTKKEGCPVMPPRGRGGLRRRRRRRFRRARGVKSQEKNSQRPDQHDNQKRRPAGGERPFFMEAPLGTDSHGAVFHQESEQKQNRPADRDPKAVCRFPECPKPARPQAHVSVSD